MTKWVIGIDEAGRGPLAGPVAVGVVVVGCDFDWELLPGVNDSKQLSEKKREELYEMARRLNPPAQLDYVVAMVSAKVIDKIGIVPAINLAMRRALKRLENNSPQGGPREVSLGPPWGERCKVLLDGGLIAPARFVHQETIVKGDSKEQIIGLASILAKVTRDRYMRRLASLAAYQPYDFATHKGYGTKAHRIAIAKNGPSAVHRVSFCRNIPITK